MHSTGLSIARHGRFKGWGDMKLRSALATFALLLAFTIPAAAGGFDQYGYNYSARLFVGPADGVDRNLDGTVWGDPTYANDLLVMKWSKAWDDARFNGGAWTTDAWLDNEWNGNVPGGSGTTEHVKIVWSGPCDATTFTDGGYCIWGQFEVIFDKGTDASHARTDLAQARPAGYGAGR